MKTNTLIRLLDLARSLNVQNEDEADKVIDSIVLELGDNITSDTRRTVTQYVVGEASMKETLERLGR